MEKTLRILLIEDDADDVELLQDSLENNNIDYRMDVLSDGGAVSGYLKTMTEFPDIIVMDLNLPKVHGKEILKEIKSSMLYNQIPVVVLTTSSSAEDKNQSLSLGASACLIKPTTTKGLSEIVAVIVDAAKGGSTQGQSNH